eukprot:m.78063 g.78063  ORF g.78063 m.78063 type:complete len:393 (-) comp16215_c0_seq2:781-1959(-)
MSSSGDLSSGSHCHATASLDESYTTAASTEVPLSTTIVTSDIPPRGCIKTEYSANARSKCQICRLRIVKGAWRIQLAVEDTLYPHSDGSPRIKWQSSHASCYFHNTVKPVNLSGSTQSLPYYGTLGPDSAWSTVPKVPVSPTEQGASISAAMAAVDENDSLEQILPTKELRDSFAQLVSETVVGSDTLRDRERMILELFLLHQKLVGIAKTLLSTSEGDETNELAQPEKDGDPLKSKFTQYSPNSAAHCRDCQGRLMEGDVRVGAHVFSSSARHAGYGINYWCLKCICQRPTIKRLARLHSDELGKVLPGAELLAKPDIERVCALLEMPVPTPVALATMAQGNVRATRSGRKFNTWGGASDASSTRTEAGNSDQKRSEGAVLDSGRSKRARR